MAIDDKNQLISSDPWEFEGREETEPEIFVNPTKAEPDAHLVNQLDTTSLGMGGDYREDDNESEPELLTDPPEYDVDEVTGLDSERKKDEVEIDG